MSLPLLLALAPLAALPQSDELGERLARLQTDLEARRVELHVAGMSLAVVVDDEVVLARGFGLADVEAGRSADEHTLYAIGSSTKAFTAALAGTLVEEGRLAWDEPIGVVLPDFDLHIRSQDPEARPTLRDLLAHRTGFARADLLWAGGRAEPALVLGTISKAEPWTGFREEFVYNNIMFLAAGEACRVAAERPWGELLEERLLGPLGMTSTNWTLAAAQADERLAKGYRWDEQRGGFVHLPMRDLRSIAPAGAIHSNVLDMARWVRLQLGRGEFEGRRVLPEAVVRESWTPQIQVGGGASYGLGWFLRDWRGHRVVEHGGNIDGFAAQVGLLPDDGVGFVLLANVSATPLQALSLERVWEALLGQPADEPEAAEAGDHAPYLGRYLANFASFHDAVFEVREQAGKLAVDVPGQMLYTLKEPDAEGRWVFELTDQIAVTFQRDDAGDVVSLTMHQGGLTFEVPREGVEPPAEIDLDDARRFLGGYEHPSFEGALEVRLVRNRLAIDIPGQMLCELHAPDGEDWRVFRVNELLAVRFLEADGAVSGLAFRERGQVVECPRVEGSGEVAAAMLSLEALHALRRSDERAAALAALGAWRMQGDLRLVHMGIEGRLSATAEGHERYRTRTDLSPFALIELAYDRGVADARSDVGPREELSAVQRAWLRVEHPALPFGDWRSWFDSIRVLRAEEREGRATWVVRLEDGEGVAITAWVDAETGDTLFEAFDAPLPGGVGSLHKTRGYSDVREVEGLRVPYASWVEDEANGRIEFTLERLEGHLSLPAGAFGLESDRR